MSRRRSFDRLRGYHNGHLPAEQRVQVGRGEIPRCRAFLQNCLLPEVERIGQTDASEQLSGQLPLRSLPIEVEGESTVSSGAAAAVVGSPS
jgi:hypothetical protein